MHQSASAATTSEPRECPVCRRPVYAARARTAETVPRGGCKIEVPLGVLYFHDPIEDGVVSYCDRVLAHRLTAMVRDHLQSMSMLEREDFFRAVTTGYCRECGTDDLPCRCWDDS